MRDITQTKEDISTIHEIFHSFDLAGSKAQIFDYLVRFEQKTSSFITSPALSAIIKWHKNLFLQMVRLFPRAEQLLDEAFYRSAAHDLTRGIDRRHFFLRRALPVDIRHNAKIFREELALWAAERLTQGVSWR